MMREESLPGFGIGMTMDDFQIDEIVIWYVVNVTAEVNDFRCINLDTNRVSREEVCLPSFEVVNCRLK